MKLVPASDPILSTPPERFDFANPPIDPVKLFNDLRDAMVKHRGVGLSANQVGIPYQVFVAGDPNDRDNIIGMFNPRIVFQSDQMVTIEEGCLTYPGLFLKVDRPAIIRVRCADASGAVNTHMYDGLPARVIQHEMDHMLGTNFTKHVSRLKLDRAKQQKKKLDKLRQSNMERLAKHG